MHLRHGDAPVVDGLDRASAALAKIAPGAPVTLRRIRDAQQGQPGAANYEGDRSVGQGSRRWCFEHESEPGRGPCPDGCAHATVIPARSDVPGEAAVVDDQARADERRYLAAAHRVARDVETMRAISAAYAPRRATAAEQLNTPCCDLCGELDNPDTGMRYAVPSRTKMPSNVGRDDLAVRRRCSWHEQFARDHERDAELAETRQHLAGGRVMVRDVGRAS